MLILHAKLPFVPTRKIKTFSDYIQLCADVDPASHKLGLTIGAALKQLSVGLGADGPANKT